MYSLIIFNILLHINIPIYLLYSTLIMDSAFIKIIF
jgi:hypothetical protein